MGVDNSAEIDEQVKSGITQERPQAVEQKTYLPDQKLTEQEKRMEGESLITGFTDILKEDPDVQRALIDKYFRYNFASESDTRFGTFRFKKGTGDYTVDTIRTPQVNHDPFYIARTEGGITESLSVDRGWRLNDGKFTKKPSIEYSVSDPNARGGFRFETKEDIRRRNSGSTVIKGRELLAKVRNDFGPIQPVNPASTVQAH